MNYTAIPCVLLFALCSGCMGGMFSQPVLNEDADPSVTSTVDPVVPDKTPVDTATLCRTPQAFDSPFNRLTNRQYAATIKTLFDVEIDASGFLPDERVNWVRRARTAPPALVDQQFSVAQQVTAEVLPRLSQMHACDPDVQGAQVCAESFITSWGSKVFRRPIQQDEVDRYKALYEQGASQEPAYEQGMELVLQAMLLSPQFLYHVEPVETGSTQEDIVLLSDYELASRLSYFFWGTMPDEALFEAASRGELQDETSYAQHASRMLADPRARVGVTSFFEDWLGMQKLAQAKPNAELYPDFTPQIAQDLQVSLSKTLEHHFWTSGKLKDLMGSADIHMTPALEQYFTGQQTLEQAGVMPFEADRRAGFLTHPGMMALHALANETDIIHRGVWVSRQLLCHTLPPPPPISEEDLAAGEGSKTQREHLSAITAPAACQACHSMINPLGFGLERFGIDGAYRETEPESGEPIDSTGSLGGRYGIESFDDGLGLAQQLAVNPTVSECFSTQWMTFAMSRALDPKVDACSQATVRDIFESTGGDLKALLVGVATSDMFRYRRVASTSSSSE